MSFGFSVTRKFFVPPLVLIMSRCQSQSIHGVSKIPGPYYICLLKKPLNTIFKCKADEIGKHLASSSRGKTDHNPYE